MMRLVRYKVKPQHAADNERLVRDVFQALHAAAPDGVRYATFKGDDGLTFVHLVSHASEAGRDALTGLPAFKAFSAAIRERCDEAPQFTELTLVGTYGVLDGAEVPA